MSNLRNSFKMIFILKGGKLLKVKDIAKELEVSEKQVKRYKEVLEEFFDIESFSGPNGGYRMKETYFPFKEVLTEDEIRLLKYTFDSFKETLSDENKMIKKAIDKINYSILNSNDETIEYDHIIHFSRNKAITKELKTTLDNLYKAIIESREIIITYMDNKGEKTRRNIQPYQYFSYKGEKYLVANCLLRNDIRYFKVRRIKDYILTSRNFQRNIDIKAIIKSHKKNRLGIFSGKEYKLVLEINPLLANTIKEKIWVDNQEIIEGENGSIIFKAVMQVGPEVISWILSMGDSVKIIEPISLKVKVREKLNKMIKNF